jgi:hypothetical protein
VYGQVVRVYSADPYIQIIRFSSQPGEFLLLGEFYYIDGIAVGQCVAVEGVVRQSSSYLYMPIDDALKWTSGLSWCDN